MNTKKLFILMEVLMKMMFFKIFLKIFPIAGLPIAQNKKLMFDILKFY